MEKINSKNKNIKISIIIVLFILIFIFMLIPVSKKTYLYFADKSLSVLRPDNITLSFHDFYSNETKESVINFVSVYLKENKINEIDLVLFNKLIKKEFSFIKVVEWDFSSPENVVINVFGKKPLCYLNDTKIISADRSILDLNFYNDFKPTFSRQLSLKKNALNPSRKKVSDAKNTFLKKLPDYLWKNYVIDYQNKYNIFLTNIFSDIPRKKRFLFTKKNIFDEKKLLCASEIFQNLFKLNKLFRDKKYILDLRFDNRILLRNDRGIG